jgi:hypothetical protein
MAFAVRTQMRALTTPHNNNKPNHWPHLVLVLLYLELTAQRVNLLSKPFSHARDVIPRKLLQVRVVQAMQARLTHVLLYTAQQEAHNNSTMQLLRHSMLGMVGSRMRC